MSSTYDGKYVSVGRHAGPAALACPHGSRTRYDISSHYFSETITLTHCEWEELQTITEDKFDG